AGLQSVTPEEIESIPVPGVSPDLAAYLTQLPGVVTSGDRGGALFIRGGAPTENGVYLDGMLLYQPFHILGFYSAFPADLVNRADVYAGGFGAEFGGRISSIIDISARNGVKRGVRGSASISPFMATGRLEGAIVPGRLSFLGSIRESLVEEVGADIIDEPLPYKFGDAFGKLHANLSKSVQVSVTGISTHDRGFIVPPAKINPDSLGRSDQVSWANQAAGARLLVLPATVPILAEILLSYSTFENKFGPSESPARSSEVSRAGAKVNFTYFLRNFDFRFGLSVYSLTLLNRLGGQFQQIDDSKEFVTEGSAYLETEIKTIPGVRITAGIRAMSFPSVGYTSLEPRLKAVWRLGIHQFSAAAGFYTQQIVGLNDRRDAGDVFTAWTPSEAGQTPPSATHLIAGYKVSTSNVLNLSIEGYFKNLTDLVIPEWTSFPRFTTNLQPADGTVLGLDVRAEVSTRRFYGYVTYGYSTVEYKAGQQTIPLWFGTETLTFNPPHDRNHQLTTMAKISVLGFDMSALWQFGSGTPFSRAIGFDEYLLVSGTSEEVDVREESGEERVIYGPPYDARLPNYHRLDLSLSRVFKLGRRADATIKFDLINAYDRDNLFYLDLFTLVRVDQLP
ncbi:MAG: TonB-dependent receptor plug domain-containing protein, partial [Rhodothermia bacterium]